ncbi:MAG: DUF6143 family protein [Candidatus Gastranaerophilales bacterium]|nr:DUF6143 family protein [Candidatus Gastranaerophilales bacterium]
MPNDNVFNNNPNQLLTNSYLYGDNINAIGQGQAILTNGDNMLGFEDNYVMHSLKGEYFVGTLPPFSIAVSQAAVVAIKNPVGSGRTVFVTVTTVSLAISRTVAFYFDATYNLADVSSTYKVNANRGSANLPVANLVYSTGAGLVITGGSLAFYRNLTKGDTVEFDQGGKFILPPGHNYTLYFEPDPTSGSPLIAFGWWEKPLT